MSKVSIQQLQITLSGNAIIPALDLEVAEGEFLVLLGPSGCGKSTLLHSIAGLIDVSDGRIEIGGEDMTWADPKDRHIGMVFQSYALYPTMNVERNLAFGLRINGTDKAEIQRRVDRAAEILQLGPLLKRKPAQLSGGQRQRVAIGRALVRQARVFLFDEPLSNLDAKLRGELRREIKQLHKQLRSTMIYVTHDQVEAMTLANRIAVMKDGRIQQIGAPGEVYARPANRFVAGFLGSPGMNFIEGQLQQQGDSWHFHAPGLALPLAGYAFQGTPQHGMPVTLGVRPEHLQLRPGAGYQAQVTLVEPMGNHQVVWLQQGQSQLAAMLAEDLPVSADSRVDFGIDQTRISLFSGDNGQRL
ncbi:sn-glycerol-3-phosphate ABC transporter ATP-binding protein UgpC [Chitinimonas sp.]|uniref:ABC transporter ATP-binding protein n=1 Tax=Chitinimonas sp. TaxID=1934313 RepID=UPI002F922A16